MNTRVFLVVVCCLLASFAPRSHAQFGHFTVNFHNCSEFAGEGPIPLANAIPLVPHGFTIAGASTGTANIVVRATNCQSASVDGLSPMPTTLSQIGINVVPPDGTGDINNYTILYLSNNPVLVTRFLLAGLPAQYDPQIAYEYPAGAAGNGNLYVSAGTAFLPSYTIFGPETAPAPNSAQDFLANWWYSSPLGRMRQQTDFPQISFGTSSVTLYTSLASPLGRLIGGNTFSNFSTLALRGIYPSAHMEVTLSH